MNVHSHILYGLYAVTDGSLTPDVPLADAVAAAIRGGARLVQYRDKSGDLVKRTHEAKTLLDLCREYEIPLVINDDVELVAQLGADGVHLGREDAPLDEARVRLGPRAIIGVSCYDSLKHAIAAQHAGADYIAFGSFYPSPSKPQAVRTPLALLAEARQQLSVPICAIGGITPENGSTLVAAGADMLAVISGLFAQTDIEAVARRYMQLFK